MDTVKPKISSIIIDKPEAVVRNIIVKVSDNFSGVKTYRGEIDGKWILMEYDYKNNVLVYTFDERIDQTKPHTFTIQITDYKGNSTIANKEF
jgi:hypothetical protein